jgi:hypothetical protein
MTLRQVIDILGLDDKIANYLREVFKFAIEDDDSPLVKCNFGNMKTYSTCVFIKSDNDINIVLNVLLAATLHSCVEIRFFASIPATITIVNTNDKYTMAAFLTGFYYDVFADTTGSGMDVVQLTGATLCGKAKQEFKADEGDGTVRMYAGTNSQGSKIQCFIGDKQRTS